jgi:NAD(P)H-dependent FMN reductase
MKKVLFIVGSLRAESCNRQLAKEAEKIIGQQAEISYLDYSDVPLMDQSIEYPAPEAVTRLRQAIAEADGIWIFTPEYNQSYPGHLKNIIDWLSRPVKPMDFETPTVIAGKKFAVSGGGGKAATAYCREKLGELLAYVGADLMTEPQTGIAFGMEAWTENKLMLTDEQKESLRQQAEAFINGLTD